MPDTQRVEFTKEMKKNYKVLLPNMCDIHFRILRNVFVSFGYDAELLRDTDQRVIDVGLKYVHNDTCYPALLTIGQMISALQSGKYDTERTALVMTQTGGGCRASNYIHLLRKALKNAGFAHVPVISINVAGLEKNSGFKLSLPLIRRVLAALTYGDMLMLLSNQTKPYELTPGQSEANVERWVEHLSKEFENGRAYRQREMRAFLGDILDSFDHIPIHKEPKVKVGIVGEIYVKYSALANNSLEDFLASEGCEVMVPGILGFLNYCVLNNIEDIKLYGGSKLRRRVIEILYGYLRKFELILIETVRKSPKFVAPSPTERVMELAKPVIGSGCKMGEGWLLTGEIMELIGHGYPNIVCAQPFGCLPNHIIGKGMIRRIREMREEANIVPIDYDPGATRVNQENRVKLMLAVAREKLMERNGAERKEPVHVHAHAAVSF